MQTSVKSIYDKGLKHFPGYVVFRAMSGGNSQHVVAEIAGKNRRNMRPGTMYGVGMCESCAHSLCYCGNLFKSFPGWRLQCKNGICEAAMLMPFGLQR